MTFELFDMLTSTQMLNVGISYRQLDHWTNRGYLRCDERVRETKGIARRWPTPERDIAQLMDRLITAGLAVGVAAPVAREMVETGMPEASVADGITILVERR